MQRQAPTKYDRILINEAYELKDRNLTEIMNAILITTI